MAGVPSNWQFYQIKFEFSIVLPTNFSVDIFNFQIYCGEIDFTIIFICIEMNIPTKIEKIIEDSQWQRKLTDYWIPILQIEAEPRAVIA